MEDQPFRKTEAPPSSLSCTWKLRQPSFARRGSVEVKREVSEVGSYGVVGLGFAEAETLIVSL